MSHALRVGVVDQIGYFRAYNTDGSAKTDLTSSTTGLTLSVFRVGATAVSISSLSAKAADNTAHSDGAIRAVSGNLYTVDLPDAACAAQVPSISVKGSYTGGVIEGPEHPLVGYDPASVAVGALTPTTANRTIDVSEAGAVTVSSIGANVVTASALAADAVAEIQSGLATAATALSTTQWTNTLATNIGTTNTTVATNLDATVSSRLASASYTAPPTAAGNASAVRTELTAELADIVSMDGRLPAALVSGFMSSSLGDTDHGGSAATLSLSTIEIEPDSANTPGVFIRGTGSGAAVDVKGGENADGIKARSGDTSGYGICSNGVEGGARFWSTNGYGVRVSSDNNNAFSVYGGVYAFQINSLNNAIDIYSSTGNAVYLQSNSNDAVVIYPGADDVGVHIWGGQTSGDAVALSSNGTGSVFYPVDLSGLNDLSAAEVNAEVLDVMNVDTFAELAAPPAATSSLRAKITWLFMWARNKSTQTSTERKLFADDTTTIVGTETVGDSAGVFTKGEAS